MEAKSNYVFPILFLFLLCCSKNMYHVQAQPSTTGYNCTANQSSNSCQTYVIYRATAPNFLDLASISDLFAVTRLMIAKASNISSPNSPLLPDQLLLVPIKCSCNTVNSRNAISYASLIYSLKWGDTLYLVSSQNFQNLVTYQSVLVVNPNILDYSNITNGTEIVFPIFCKCPNSTQLQNQVNYLISYVFQQYDTLSTIALRFGSTEQSMIEVNGNNIRPLDTVFIPVSRLPKLTQPIVPPPAAALPLPLPLEKNERKGAVIGLGIGLGICGLLLVLVCGVWCYKEALIKRMGGICRDEEKQKAVGKGQKRFLKPEEVNLMADVAGCLDKYKIYRIDELRRATNGFDDKSIIKGSVYRGCIDEELYAIKKIKWDAYEELKILQKVNHGNLVRLEGFCIDPEESNCYVVYEYLENGSLYSWLHEKKNKKLSWNTRLRIAIDIANGLQYIHEHTRPKVVHKDIKSSNILLDSNMRAKIASFGLAKSGCNAITMHIVGTRGYIAPEYLADGVVSTKMDVFSFGVVLLELISAGEVIDEEGKFLWASVDGILDENEEGKLRKLREWMDECLTKDSCTIESVINVMAVAVACLHKDPAKRPSMVEIVYALSRTDDFILFDVYEDGPYPR